MTLESGQFVTNFLDFLFKYLNSIFHADNVSGGRDANNSITEAQILPDCSTHLSFPVSVVFWPTIARAGRQQPGEMSLFYALAEGFNRVGLVVQ